MHCTRSRGASGLEYAVLLAAVVGAVSVAAAIVGRSVAEGTWTLAACIESLGRRCRASHEVPVATPLPRMSPATADRLLLGALLPMPNPLQPLESLAILGEDANTAPRALLRGQPFVRGPGDAQGAAPGDLTQGQLNDCFFIASAGAIAQTNPGFLEESIRRSPRLGQWQVRLYPGNLRYRVVQRDAAGRVIGLDQTPATLTFSIDGAAGPTWVETNQEFPVFGAGHPAEGRPIGVQPGNPAPGGGVELWPMLLEQGLARTVDMRHVQLWPHLPGAAPVDTRTGYDGINHNGWAAVSLTLLTGQPSTYHVDLTTMKLATVAEFLRTRHAVVAGTMDAASVPEGQRGLFVDAPNAPARLLARHDYWVESVDVTANTITLRNPQGGTVTLPWADAQRVLRLTTNPVLPPRAEPLPRR